jgi:hypothetical protein
VWRENWGEQLEGSYLPRIFVLDLAAGSNAQPVPVVGVDLDDWSVGQPVWSPCGAQILFTGWPHEDRMLGLVYCMNRKSCLFTVAAPTTTIIATTTTTTTTITHATAAASPLAAVKLAGDARCPVSDRHWHSKMLIDAMITGVKSAYV